MSTSVGVDRSQYWSAVSNKDRVKYKFNNIFSRKRFDAILNALAFTENNPPDYIDRFWEVRDLIEAWNSNMSDEFVASWVTCLDESMSKWVNKYTCPGFMIVPRKPWQFGNEYHSIVCGMSDIMFAVELVEGKDEPPQAQSKEHSEKGKMVSLLLRLTSSIEGRGSIVVLDSGFCVLKGIIELRKRGIYAAAVIKKRRYWPKHIDGEGVQLHFMDKEPGTFDAHKGSLDGESFYLYCMKEPDYVSMFMTSYGTAQRMGKEQIRKVDEKKIDSNILRLYICIMHTEMVWTDTIVEGCIPLQLMR